MDYISRWFSTQAQNPSLGVESETASEPSTRAADLPTRAKPKSSPIPTEALDGKSKEGHVSDAQSTVGGSVQTNVVGDSSQPRQRKKSGRKNFVEGKMNSVPAPEEQFKTQSENVADHAVDWFTSDYGTTLPDSRRQRSHDRSADQLRAWKTFTLRLSSLVEKRIQADEIRRRVRLKRRAFVETVKNTLDGTLESEIQLTGRETATSEALAEALSELERSELRLEKIEDELVQAESAIAKSLPVVSGSQGEKTFEFLQQSALDFQSVSSESERSLRSDIGDDLNLSPERQRLLSKLDEVNSLEEQLIELRADRQQLQTWDEADLSSKEISFLKSYHDENAKLKKSLRIAKAELERLTDILQRSAEETSSPRAVEPATKDTTNLAVLSLGTPP